MGKSSKDKRDAYYRLAKEQNWRARSAFKLIQLDEQFDLFSYEHPEQCTRVVDLCAAPGSWSQVLSRILIKGESFGRRTWVEKMEKFRSDIESRTQVEYTVVTAAEDKAPVELMSDLNIADDKANNDHHHHHHHETPNPTTQVPVSQQHQQPPSTTSPPSSPSIKPTLQPRPNVKIVAIDLQPMSPLTGITQLKADITHPSTIPLLLRALDIDPSLPVTSTSQVDLVISDGAPDVTGLHDLDIYIQATLLHSALSLAIKVLRQGGKFVAKIFRGRNCDVIYAQLRCCFEKVTVAKPRSSRASSLEAFVVCEGFNGVRVDPMLGATEGYEVDGAMVPSVREEGGIDEEEEEVVKVDVVPVSPINTTVRDDGMVVLEFPEDPKSNRWIAPFLACGDLDSYDADATYKLPPGHVSLPPVQPPTAPPYKEAIERRRREGGMYGKTKHKDRESKAPS